MSTILLHAARALTPTTEIPDAGILIRDGVIEAVGPRQDMTLPSGAAEISAPGQTAIPGFIDIHIHGAGGHDVMEGTGRSDVHRGANSGPARHDFFRRHHGYR